MDGEMFYRLGVSTGCITNDLNDLQRKKIMTVTLLTQRIMS